MEADIANTKPVRKCVFGSNSLSKSVTGFVKFLPSISLILFELFPFYLYIGEFHIFFSLFIFLIFFVLLFFFFFYFPFPFLPRQQVLICGLLPNPACVCEATYRESHDLYWFPPLTPGDTDWGTNQINFLLLIFLPRKQITCGPRPPYSVRKWVCQYLVLLVCETM